jgi:uncharacterized lipoprotein YmbA
MTAAMTIQPTPLVRLACAMALTGLLAACSSAPPPQFITLPASEAPLAASPAASAGGGITGPVLVVRRVAVPEYLDVSAVRFRAEDSTLGEWPNTTWAERPAVALTRELVARLRVALPGWTVCDGACPGGLSGWVLQAEWGPLDYQRDSKQLRAELRYTVTTADASTTPRSAVKRLSLPVSPDSATGQARALAAVVDDAARTIAAGMR